METPQYLDKIVLGDSQTEVNSIPDEQILADKGIYQVYDQYGNQHWVTFNGDYWEVVFEDELWEFEAFVESQLGK